MRGVRYNGLVNGVLLESMEARSNVKDSGTEGCESLNIQDYTR